MNRVNSRMMVSARCTSQDQELCKTVSPEYTLLHGLSASDRLLTFRCFSSTSSADCATASLCAADLSAASTPLQPVKLQIIICA
jgi:hypothetical protein